METKSRKKNYVAVVNRALWQHLIGKNLKHMPVIKKNGKNFYFFSNFNVQTNPERILEKFEQHSKNGQNFCFGVFKMKNHKEYYFLCIIDTLYLTEKITHIHSKPKIVVTIKKQSYV